MAGWQNDGKNISGTNNSRGESRNLMKKKGEKKKANQLYFHKL